MASPASRSPAARPADRRPPRYPGRVTRAPGGRAGTARRQRLPDAVLAGALLGLVEFTVFAKLPAGPAWIIAATGAAAVVPLAWRRRAPFAVLVISGTATLAAMLYHGSPGLLAGGPLAALYTVSTSCPRRTSLAAALLTLAGATAGVAAGHRGALTWESFALPWAVIAASWLIGDNLRVRRAYVAELEARAARADADRAAEAARATARERARIARELHDMVVHHVSIIAVRAGAARLLAGRGASPADTRQALADVEATARQALGELRQLLGILRHDCGPPARTATPGLGPARPPPRRRPPGRPSRRVPDRGGIRRPARRGRCFRLPHRAGGADQRASSTRAACPRACSSATPPMSSRSRSPTTGPAPPRPPPPAPAMAWRACGNGSPCSAGNWDAWPAPGRRLHGRGPDPAGAGHPDEHHGAGSQTTRRCCGPGSA